MILKDKNITIAYNSLKGIARTINQDDILILHTPNFYLLVLFDGVSSLEKSIYYIQYCKGFLEKNFKSYINSEIKLNQLIYDMHLSSIESSIEGKTTCSALLIHFELKKAFIVNIGDSRIYSYSNRYLISITNDDNVPNYKNILTKYIGLEGLKQEDISQTEVNIDQDFLICSDGFYSLMEENKKRYFMIFQFKRMKNTINAIDKIQKYNNNDDSTYIIIKRNGI